MKLVPNSFGGHCHDGFAVLSTSVFLLHVLDPLKAVDDVTEERANQIRVKKQVNCGTPEREKHRDL